MTKAHPGASPYRDRHGKERWRYRRAGDSRMLPHSPGHPDFEVAYQAAVEGRAPRPARVRKSHVQTHQRWVTDIRRLAAVENFFEHSIARAKNRATAQNVAFALEPSHIKDALDAQEWRCAISGMPFEPTILDRVELERPFRPSIDRIIPANGYVPSNIRIVCMIANFAMSNWGARPLLAMLVQIDQQRVTGSRAIRKRLQREWMANHLANGCANA